MHEYVTARRRPAKQSLRLNREIALLQTAHNPGAAHQGRCDDDVLFSSRVAGEYFELDFANSVARPVERHHVTMSPGHRVTISPSSSRVYTASTRRYTTCQA